VVRKFPHIPKQNDTDTLPELAGSLYRADYVAGNREQLHP
jgi:hypothetical protein